MNSSFQTVGFVLLRESFELTRNTASEGRGYLLIDSSYSVKMCRASRVKSCRSQERYAKKNEAEDLKRAFDKLDVHQYV